MSHLLVKDGALAVRLGGLVVGACAPCCGDPEALYFEFTACSATFAPPALPCGSSGPLPGLERIFVDGRFTCAGGNGTTIQQFVEGSPNAQAVIFWAGACYVSTGFVYRTSCENRPLPCNVLPVGAQGPAGPTVQCVNNNPLPCSQPICNGPTYFFLKRCHGEPTGGFSPNVFVCMEDMYAFFVAGGRCPTFQVLMPGGGAGCFYVDLNSASNFFPANFNRITFLMLSDGCCTCIGNPCVQAESHSCTNVGGFVGGLVPLSPIGTILKCCAHAISGTATVTWRYTASFAGQFQQSKIGSATRSGGILTGSWTRNNGGSVETFPIAGPSTPSSEDFSVRTILNSDEVSGLVEKTWSGFPCPTALTPGPGISTVGTWRSTCTTFSMSCVVIDGQSRQEFEVNYSCAPNPGICETGCSTNQIRRPNQPLPGITPIGPGPGDSGGLIDFGPLLRALGGGV